MAIRKKVGETSQYLRLLCRQWKYDYTLRIAKPKLFSVAFVIGLVAILLSEKAIIDYKYEVMDPKADALESVAMAIEKTPDLWLTKIEAKKGTVSEYQYQLEYQQYEYFARKAPALAEKVRDKKFWEVLNDTKKLGAEQVAQYATGKVAGRATRYIGARVGTKIGRAGVQLINQGYNTAGRVAIRGGTNLVKSGQKFGEVLTSLIWEIGSAVGKEGTMPPSRQLAEKSEEFKALFDLINQATEENPDKLMTAALHHVIQNVSYAKDDSPENYRNSVMIAARTLSNMTQAGGSPSSMWKDVDELAKWIASKIGRPLPEEPEEESESETLDLANFSAFGGFSDLEERLGYPADHWKINHISITVKDGKIVKGTGILEHEVETSALHTWDKQNFTFTGTFKPVQGENIGTFEGGRFIRKEDKYSSVTDFHDVFEYKGTWRGTLAHDGTIIGYIDGWPGEFRLELDEN